MDLLQSFHDQLEEEIESSETYNMKSWVATHMLLFRRDKLSFNMQSMRAICSVMALAVWWGGLTFYALVVVPIGTHVFGSIQQGFVTQQATNWLNVIGGVALLPLLWNVIELRRPLLTATWLAMAVTLGAVSYLHVRLDGLLGGDVAVPSVDPNFYDVHRIYLLVTAIQWIAQALHLAGLVGSRISPANRISC